MNELQQQALAKSKAEYEALGYSVKKYHSLLVATKGIYKARESWFENGQQHYIYNYINGEMDGKQESWFENGQREFIHNCKNDKLDGKQEAWKKDGTPLPAQLWKDGKFVKNIENEIISKQITYAEYKAIQRSKFWNGVFWIGSIVLFVGLFLANSCFEIKLFD